MTNFYTDCCLVSTVSHDSCDPNNTNPKTRYRCSTHAVDWFVDSDSLQPSFCPAGDLEQKIESSLEMDEHAMGEKIQALERDLLDQDVPRLEVLILDLTTKLKVSEARLEAMLEIVPQLIQRIAALEDSNTASAPKTMSIDPEARAKEVQERKERQRLLDEKAKFIQDLSQHRAMSSSQVVNPLTLGKIQGLGFDYTIVDDVVDAPIAKAHRDRIAETFASEIIKIPEKKKSTGC